MKKRIAAAVAACAVALTAFAGCTQQQAANTNANVSADKRPLHIEMTADGYDQTSSSQFVAHITGEGTDMYVAFDANTARDVELASGEYEVTVAVPAVNADGSTYRVGEDVAGSTVKVSLAEGAKADEKATEAGISGGNAVTGKVEAVPADEVGDERRAAIASAATKAAAADPAMKDVCDRAVGNLKAAPDADTDAIEEAADQARQEAATDGGGSSTGNDGGQQAPNGGGSQASTEPSGSGSSSGSGGSAPSEPVHEHSWTYHEAVYEYRDVYVGEYVLCSCGAQFPTQAAWSAHNQSLGFGVSHSYSVKSIYDVQRVCVRDAYYSCSCGAEM